MMRAPQDPSPACRRPEGWIEHGGARGCNVGEDGFTCDKITDEVECWDDVERVRFGAEAALELRNGEPINICDA